MTECARVNRNHNKKKFGSRGQPTHRSTYCEEFCVRKRWRSAKDTICYICKFQAKHLLRKCLEMCANENKRKFFSWISKAFKRTESCIESMDSNWIAALVEQSIEFQWIFLETNASISEQMRSVPRSFSRQVHTSFPLRANAIINMYFYFVYPMGHFLFSLLC